MDQTSRFKAGILVLRSQYTLEFNVNDDASKMLGSTEKIAFRQKADPASGSVYPQIKHCKISISCMVV